MKIAQSTVSSEYKVLRYSSKLGIGNYWPVEAFEKKQIQIKNISETDHSELQVPRLT